MTRGSGGYIFNANIVPSRFSNQWLDWGVWQIWSSAISASTIADRISIGSSWLHIYVSPTLSIALLIHFHDSVGNLRSHGS